MRIIVAKFNKTRGVKGFTLIELMVAVAILMISMTAILDFLIQYHRINLENAMRNESLRVAEARLEQLRNSPFDTLTLGTFSQTTSRRIRNISVDYDDKWLIESVSATSIAVRSTVGWTYRGIHHEHNAATIISTDVF